MSNTVTIPTAEVQGPYLLDPETEDLLWGDQLDEGMVVLAESEGARSASGLAWSRWCRVTDIRHRASYGFKFIGVYADGSKVTRQALSDHAWFVKRDSIPSEDPPL